MQLKRKVVMLSTNEKAKVGDMIQCVNPSEKLKAWKNILGKCHVSESSKEWKKVDLYFLYDEEIKEGDWFYDTRDKIISNKCLQVTMFSKKIIATTDTSLKIILNNYQDGPITYNKFEKSLPQPSKTFIESYIKAYNEGNPITEVMIEYNEFYELNDPTGKYTERELKVKPDNTISIKKVKDSWTREEVHNLMMQAWINGEANPNQHFSIRETWIENNL